MPEPTKSESDKDADRASISHGLLAVKYFKPPYHAIHNTIWSADGHKIADVRGWGRLTGSAVPDRIADHEEAAKVQDSIGEWIAEALTIAANA